MPIIEQISADQPLSQGDILDGVSLFVTEKCWDPGGGEASRLKKQGLCLVASRPCVPAHKLHVNVLFIDQLKGGVPKNKEPKLSVEKTNEGKPKSADTLEYVIGYLTETRDGTDTPDQFYLGEIPGRSGRFVARFDSWHSIEIPAIGAQRDAFLRNHRVGRISKDFVSDLHYRVFRSVATLGFDDYGWFPDSDLKWILEIGNAELKAAESNLHTKQAEMSKKEFEGNPIPAQQVQIAQKSVDEIRSKLAPYLAESARRQE